ncbi:caspase family protein [Streptomyces sp. NPDC007088]|uniref:HD domain-containing protein n=1 Tax=Streptomyces sp. NPDC007088 TaxID=3364773 RepID=UPI0036AA9652
MAQQQRRALLMGVGETPRTTRFAPLAEVVRQDLAAMHEALRNTGFTVSDPLLNRDRDSMNRAVEEATAELPEGGILLLYFTGHGIRIEGRDYLVPASALGPEEGGRWTRSARSSLFPVDIQPWLEGPGRARKTVLWVLDACRDPDEAEEFGSGVRGEETGADVTLLGCEAGQKSRYDDNGSFFTRGLAEALGRLDEARTLDEVFLSARTRTARLAGGGHRQRPRIAYDPNRGAELRKLVVCEGRPLLTPWREAVRDTGLWQRVEPDTDVDLDRLRAALDDLVTRVATARDQAERVLARQAGDQDTDPWSDPLYPVRLLEDTLPLLLPAGRCELSALEVAALIAAPFLYEAAYAHRLNTSRDVEPHRRELAPSGDHSPDVGNRREEYDHVLAEHAGLADRMWRLGEAGRLAEATSIRMWLLHRYVADSFATEDRPFQHELETMPGEVGALVDGLHGAPEKLSPERRKEFVAPLYRIAGGLVAGGTLDTSVGDAPAEEGVFLREGRKQRLRADRLARLLRVAATLAVDVRALPDVLSEHLGVTDEVTPAQVCDTVRDLRWEPDAEARVLSVNARCPHPALHAALDEIRGRADRLVSTTGASAEPPALGVLPQRVTDLGNLRAVSDVEHRPVYTLPLARFHLAHTEVRELLMGEALYGEPELALRELYQNAMDACRYQAKRLEFTGALGSWKGLIEFEEGVDERTGRRYVECRDNGVGMSAEQLEHTFARAGSRFENSREFRREQKRWARRKLAKLYPNSRFGIGVFSYFMLADSMTIVTRRTDTQGVPSGQALSVEIPSSGSLLRIRPVEPGSTEDKRIEGGTRIRLYLREDDRIRALSCVDALRSLVAVSEFRLRARDASGEELDFEEGSLQSSQDLDASGALPVPGTPLWWVKGRGALLCDGIRTDETPFGYVVDLRSEHAGRLSVSRKELQGWDRDWVAELWSQGAAALRDWPELTLGWLWDLEAEEIRAARTLWDQWKDEELHVRAWRGSVRSLHSVGWFEQDRELIRDEHRNRRSPYLPWRAAVHGFESTRKLASPRRLDHLPLAIPGYAQLLDGRTRDWRSVQAGARTQQVTYSWAIRSLRRLRPLGPRAAPPPVRPGPSLDWVPTVEDVRLSTTLAGGWGRLGFDTPMGPDDPQDVRGLVVMSRRLNLPLDTLWEGCTRIAQVLSPPAVPAHHRGHVVTPREIRALSETGSAFFQSADIRGRSDHRTHTPWSLHAHSVATGIPVAELLRTLADYAWLGWRAPGAEAMERWDALPADGRAVLGEGIFAQSGRDTEGGWRVGWNVVVSLAADRQLTLKSAEDTVAAWARGAGLSFRPLCSSAPGSPRPDAVPTSLAGRLMDALPPWEPGSRWSVHDDFRAQKSSLSPGELSEAVRSLLACGIDVGPHSAYREAWERGDVPATVRIHEVPGIGRGPRLPTAYRLIQASARSGHPLSQVWADGLAVVERYGLPELPSLPAALRDRRAELTDAAALFSERGSRSLSAESLARAAHGNHRSVRRQWEHFLPYRELGADIPEISDEELEQLPGTVPDPWDLVALSAEARAGEQRANSTALRPLDLVSIAARIGETTRETWERIRPYRPLLPAEPLVGEVLDVLPLWQDLAVLSQHLDGLEPALERVTAEHLAFAAEGVEETEDWVRERLRLYTGMFSLRWDDDLD